MAIRIHRIRIHIHKIVSRDDFESAAKRAPQRRMLVIHAAIDDGDRRPRAGDIGIMRDGRILMDQLWEIAPWSCGQQNPRLKRLGKKTTATPFVHGRFSAYTQRTGVLYLSDGLECMAYAAAMGTAKVARPTKNKTSPRLVCSA